MDRTPNLDLPYILPSQAQKHVTHNEAIRALDAIAQAGVLNRSLATAPASPAEGDRHIVAAGATGTWSGHDLEIAAWQDGAWMFYAPKTGWAVWIDAEGVLVLWDGSMWTIAGGPNGNFETASINGASADTVNRIAANSHATMLNHDGTGHQLKINKNAAADTASVLFQTGFSGRAEFGLAGDDNWHVKVSANGTNWHEALIVDTVDGKLGLGGAPVAPFHLYRNLDGFEQTVIVENQSSHASAQVRIGLELGSDAGTSAAKGGVWFVTPTALGFADYEARQMKLFTGATAGTASSRLDITKDGDIGIGTASPSTKLDVNGPVKVGSYAVSAAPSASASGSGAIIFVSDESGGAVLAFSDGTNWRRTTDRAIIA